MVLCKMVKFHEKELSLERNIGGDEVFRAIHEGRSLGWKNFQYHVIVMEGVG